MKVQRTASWTAWVVGLALASWAGAPGARSGQDDGALVGVAFPEAQRRIDALDAAAGWRAPEWIVEQPNAWFVDDGALRRGGRVDAEGTAAARALRSAARFDDVEVRGFWSADGRDARLASVRVVDRLVTFVDGAQPIFHGEITSADFAEARSRAAFAPWALPSPTTGRHLGLLADGDPVWLHGVALRSLDAEPLSLLDAPVDGEAWSRVGDARYTIDGDVLSGVVDGGAQSFLVTARSFADFVLEVDVHLDDVGNSGIQVRSRVGDDGRLRGPQVEIDPSERAWSGGLYDEGRRGWLQSLAGNEAGRAAFDRDGWNRYRIECVGPRYRVWVNDVPTVDHLDPLDLEGQIAFQVHSGTNTALRWRAPRVRELGAHIWADASIDAWTAGAQLTVDGAALTASPEVASWRERALVAPTASHDVGLHLRVTAPDGLRVSTLAPDQSVGSVIDRRASDEDPAAWAHEDGRWVAALDPWLHDGEPHDVHVLCFGDRRVVHVDGRQVHALHGLADTDEPWSIAVVCPTGAGATLHALRVLERDG